MKPKGVTTQMKAHNDYFLMVVSTLLLNRVHVFANFMFNLNGKGISIWVLVSDLQHTVHWY